ncbi:hypothetical protein ACH6CV_14475 [Bacillota bacterium Meth-B3]
MPVTLKFDASELNLTAQRLRTELGPDAVKNALAFAFAPTQQFAIDTAASQVSALYNISAGAVKSTNTKGPAMSASLKIGGGDGTIAQITFSGRTLTLEKFGFSPRYAPRGDNYRVSTEIFRGHGKTFAPPPEVFIPRSKRTNKLPFHRLSGSQVAARKARDPDYRYGGKYSGPVAPIHSLSVPQMISNEELEPTLTQAIGQKLLDEFVAQFESMKG